MFDSLIIRYTELRVCHRTDLDCPEGYGRLHPAIAWEEWVAWKWYLGGFLDDLMNWYSGIPVVRRLVHATWTAHLEMIRGPWSPVRQDVFEISWERSPHPERRDREGMLLGSGRQPDAIVSIVDRPTVGIGGRTFTVFTAKTTTYRLERFQAWVEIKRAIEHARSGDDFDGPWGFLPVLRFAEMDDLRRRARVLVESETFSPDMWSAFVDGEAELAWAAYDPVILPPDPPDPTVLRMPHQADPS